MQISLYAEDYPEWVEDLEDIINNDYYSLEKEVWEYARECKDIPHIGNIYTSLVFSRLESYLLEKYDNLNLEIAYEVNSIASYFCVNQQEVKCKEDLEEIIEEALEELGIA